MAIGTGKIGIGVLNNHMQMRGMMDFRETLTRRRDVVRGSSVTCVCSFTIRSVSRSLVLYSATAVRIWTTVAKHENKKIYVCIFNIFSKVRTREILYSGTVGNNDKHEIIWRRCDEATGWFRFWHLTTVSHDGYNQ